MRAYARNRQRVMTDVAHRVNFFADCKAFARPLLAQWPGQKLIVRVDDRITDEVVRHVINSIRAL